jgi:myo-inositol-1(or 4)-monophosphatase
VEELRSLRPEAAVAAAVVREALALAVAGRGEVTVKSGRDVVTEADVGVEDLVRGRLEAATGVLVVGEERGGDARGADHWLVDPICGTRNFASGVPLWCVNLALLERGEVTLAAVGDPSTGDVIVAERGRGAYVVGGGRAQVDASSRVVVIEDGKSDGRRRQLAADCFAALIRRDEWDTRKYSSTLALAYVATGRIAGCALFVATAVHSAAGSLVAREAGATVTDIFGAPWHPGCDSIVATADAAFAAAVRELSAASARSPSVSGMPNEEDDSTKERKPPAFTPPSAPGHDDTGQAEHPPASTAR